MSSTSKRYAPEVRERAVRLVFEHQHEHESQWAAIVSVAGKTPRRREKAGVPMSRVAQRERTARRPRTQGWAAGDRATPRPRAGVESWFGNPKDGRRR